MISLDECQRIARLTLRDPRQVVDRVRGQVAVRVDKPPFEVPLPGALNFGDAVHELLGKPMPCRDCANFVDLWAALLADMGISEHEPGKGYDAGRSLAEGSYAATLHLAPDIVIETGVARGVTSRFILEALQLNGNGELFSIDLPPMNAWHGEAGSAVPDRLRGRWHFTEGASRRHLPSLVRDLKPISLFVHDSLHTTGNVLFELDTAWPGLAQGGMVLVDDVEENSGFSRFVDHTPDLDWAVAKEAERSGLVGVIRRADSHAIEREGARVGTRNLRSASSGPVAG